jgi:hypothetical protein
MSRKRMLDTLIDAFAEARARGQTPVSWKINRPAEIDLLMDERIYRSMGPK